MFINYEHYRVFYYVAKYGNFTKTANALMCNQPNITRTIKNLEQELGCTLFIRSNRGAVLTPEGEKLFSYVSAAIEALQAGENEIASGKNLQSGTVTLSVSETALHEMLLTALNQFHHKYPGIKIRLSNHSTPQAINALRSGAVELAIVTTPTDTAKPLSETVLKRFSEVLVCGKGFFHLADRTLHLSDLSDYPLICLGENTKTYEFYKKLFLEHDLILSPDMEAATTDQILPMIINDLGLGFLPESFAMPAIEKGEVIPLKLHERIPDRYICLLKNTDHPLGIAAKEFEKMLVSMKSRV